MRTVFQGLRPGGPIMQKIALLVILLGVGAGAFCWGRHGASHAEAQAPTTPSSPLDSLQRVTNTGDYSKRIVATIYDNIPVTREELGEYLIARFGKERVEFLVNRKIVEMECQQRGVFVTDAEIDDQFHRDLRGFGNISAKDFESQILRRFNKTVFEWREDVIRPKLLISKMVRPTIQVNEQDLRQAFEARYGERVQCRMILFQNKDQDRKILEKWKKACESEAAFLELAKQQYIPALAARGGEVPPIHHHFGDAKLEQTAFALKEGEVSGIVDMTDRTHVILRCEKHIGRDESKHYELERAKMRDEVFEMKLSQRIPEVFADLYKRAHPVIEKELSPASQPNPLPNLQAAPIAASQPPMSAPPPVAPAPQQQQGVVQVGAPVPAPIQPAPIAPR